jgi:hypothetical protein
MAKIAGMESTTKIRLVVSTMMNAKASGVSKRVSGLAAHHFSKTSIR